MSKDVPTARPHIRWSSRPARRTASMKKIAKLASRQPSSVASSAILEGAYPIGHAMEDHRSPSASLVECRRSRGSEATDPLIVYPWHP